MNVDRTTGELMKMSNLQFSLTPASSGGLSRQLGMDRISAPTLSANLPSTTRSIVQAAESSGFTYALIPTGHACIDTWVVGFAIVSRTTVQKPLLAMRPGLIARVLAARMGAYLTKFQAGEQLIKVVTGGGHRMILKRRVIRLHMTMTLDMNVPGRFFRLRNRCGPVPGKRGKNDYQ